MRNRTFVAAAFVLGSAICHAGVAKSADDIFTSSNATLLQRLDTLSLGVKPVVRRGDAFILVTLRAATVEILATGLPQTDAQKLAESLDRSFEQLPGTNFTYGTFEGRAAAKGLRNVSKLFQRSSTQSMDVGQVVRELRNAGWNAQVILRAPNYASVTPLRFPADTSRSWSYWNVTQAAPGDSVSVGARTTVWKLLGILAAGAGFTVVASIGFLIALFVGKNEAIPLARRRKLYSKLVNGPMFGTIAVHFPFFLWFISAGYARETADLWLGSTRSTTVVGPVMIAGLCVLVLLAVLCQKVERRIFGTPEGTPTPAMQAEADAYRAVGKTTRWLVLWVVLGFAVIYAVLRVLAPGAQPFVFPLVILAVGVVVPRVTVRQLAKNAEPIDPAVVARIDDRARRMASRMAVILTQVEVDNVAGMAQAVNAAMGGAGRLVVSGGAAKHLDDNELDALIAHECGHLQGRHLRVRALSGMVLILPFVAVIACVPLLRSLGPSPLLFLGPLMVLPLIGVLLTPRLHQHQELDADRRALSETRNLVAMESMLKKVVASSSMPGIHDVEETHPAITRRAEALRSHARAIGLIAP